MKMNDRIGVGRYMNQKASVDLQGMKTHRMFYFMYCMSDLLVTHH